MFSISIAQFVLVYRTTKVKNGKLFQDYVLSELKDVAIDIIFNVLKQTIITLFTSEIAETKIIDKLGYIRTNNK